MVNYKAIADYVDANGLRVPGNHSVNPQLYFDSAQNAYPTMAALATDKFVDVDIHTLRIWAAEWPTDYSAVKTNAATNAKADLAYRLIGDSQTILQTSNVKVRQFLQGLVIDGVLTSQAAASLQTYATKSVPDFPGLLPGHIQNALQKRDAGVI